MQKLLRIDIRIISLFCFVCLSLFCLGEMQHIKSKGNDNQNIQAKTYEGLLTIMCLK